MYSDLQKAPINQLSVYVVSSSGEFAIHARTRLYIDTTSSLAYLTFRRKSRDLGMILVVRFMAHPGIGGLQGPF